MFLCTCSRRRCKIRTRGYCGMDYSSSPNWLPARVFIVAPLLVSKCQKNTQGTQLTKFAHNKKDFNNLHISQI